MNGSKLWGIINLAISIGIVAVYALSAWPPTTRSQPVDRSVPQESPVQPVVQNAAPVGLTITETVSAAGWAKAIEDERARWLAGLASGDPAIVSANDGMQYEVPLKYRYILESLADRSPANRAQIAELLYEVSLSEHLARLAAKALNVRDPGEVERRADENSRPALSRLVLAAGADGARIAELFPLRDTMAEIEMSVRPGMEFRSAAMTVPQQIEVARAFERYGYTMRNVMNIYRRENESPGTIRAMATSVLNDAARTLSAAQVKALATYFQAEEVRAQPAHRLPGG
jgi:hypothetical protein